MTPLRPSPSDYYTPPLVMGGDRVAIFTVLVVKPVSLKPPHGWKTRFLVFDLFGFFGFRFPVFGFSVFGVRFSGCRDMWFIKGVSRFFSCGNEEIG